MSSKVRKCHFSHKGALTKVKCHFLAVFQGGVNFGSPYLRNRLSHRLLVGLNGSGRKKTFFVSCLQRFKKCFFSLRDALTKAKGCFLAVFQGGVNFGSPYLRNRLSYRLLVGPNGSCRKNTCFISCFLRLENVILTHSLFDLQTSS